MYSPAAEQTARLEEPSNVAVVELLPTRSVGLLDGVLLEEQLLLAVDDILAAVEVGLVGLDAPALHDDHVAEEEDEVQGQTEVSGDEGGIVEGLTIEDKDTKVLGHY